DKDRVAAILGRDISADVLLILTNVQAVYRAYGTPHQEAIRRLTLAQADHLLAGKELGTGSMRPKVEAAADFVRVRGATEGARAIIAELSQGLAGLRCDAGTTIRAAPSLICTSTRPATSSAATESRPRRCACVSLR